MYCRIITPIKVLRLWTRLILRVDWRIIREPLLRKLSRMGRIRKKELLLMLKIWSRRLWGTVTKLCWHPTKLIPGIPRRKRTKIFPRNLGSTVESTRRFLHLILRLEDPIAKIQTNLSSISAPCLPPGRARNFLFLSSKSAGNWGKGVLAMSTWQGISGRVSCWE